jgi:hypothetical protein
MTWTSRASEERVGPSGRALRRHLRLHTCTCTVSSSLALAMSEDAWLPPEIYHAILTKLPCTRHDDTSVRTLAQCAQASKTIRAVAIAPLVWAAHYKVRYTHYDKRVDSSRQTKYAGDWYAMYCLRRRFDHDALAALDDMERFEGGAEKRHDHVAEIINVYSWESPPVREKISSTSSIDSTFGMSYPSSGTDPFTSRSRRESFSLRATSPSLDTGGPRISLARWLGTRPLVSGSRSPPRTSPCPLSTP